MNIKNETKKPSHLTLMLFTQKFNGLCMIIDRVVKEAEKKYGKDIDFIYYDSDEDYGMTQHHSITEVPSLFIYKDEEVIDYFIGAFTKKDLFKKIATILNEINKQGETS